jgi:hypothetical protein
MICPFEEIRKVFPITHDYIVGYEREQFFRTYECIKNDCPYWWYNLCMKVEKELSNGND